MYHKCLSNEGEEYTSLRVINSKSIDIITTSVNILTQYFNASSLSKSITEANQT